MLDRGSMGVIALAVAFVMAIVDARADDAKSAGSKYPDLRGQWLRTSAVQWDPSKPPARGQQAPLTAEYQAVYDRALLPVEVVAHFKAGKGG